MLVVDHANACASSCAHSYDFVDAQHATTASILTSSLAVPSNPPAVLPSGNVLAAVVKGNGEDHNNDNDDGDDGDDPSDDTDADSDSDSDSNQVDAATKPPSSSTSSSSSTHVVTTSVAGAHSTNNKPQAANTNAAATKSHSHTTHSFPAQSTHFSFRPHPVPTASLDSPFSTSPQPPSSQSHHQPPVAIAFEVIGGLLLLTLLLCCGRCMYKYRRVPARDRISLVLDRHRLERELEEMEEAHPYRRRTSLARPPPPAYQHAPAYDEAVSDDGQSPTTPTPARSEHEELPQHPP